VAAAEGVILVAAAREENKQSDAAAIDEREITVEKKRGRKLTEFSVVIRIMRTDGK
jgi:hypothetical protein